MAGKDASEEDRVNSFLRGPNNYAQFKFGYFDSAYVTGDWVDNFQRLQKEGGYRGQADKHGHGRNSKVIVRKPISSIYKLQNDRYNKAKEECDRIVKTLGDVIST